MTIYTTLSSGIWQFVQRWAVVYDNLYNAAIETSRKYSLKIGVYYKINTARLMVVYDFIYSLETKYTTPLRVVVYFVLDCI